MELKLQQVPVLPWLKTLVASAFSTSVKIYSLPFLLVSVCALNVAKTNGRIGSRIFLYFIILYKNTHYAEKIPILERQMKERKPALRISIKSKIKKAPEKLEAFMHFAVWTGFEPATPCVTGMYSNQLNYQTVR